MAQKVNPTPQLPQSPSGTNVYEIVRFLGDLVRSLYLYLSDLARRINNAVMLDGSEPMTGNLDLGGHDITNGGDADFQDITAVTGTIGILSSPDITTKKLTGLSPTNVPNIVINGSASSENGLIEIGRVDGTASTPVIDFHAGATATDYDARIIATTGSGVAGGGTLLLHAALVRLEQGKLQFPTTQAASSNANTLDDYREASYTPVVTSGGAGTVGTHTASGAYIKIGRICLVSINVAFTGAGTSTTFAAVTLPFTTGSSGFLSGREQALVGHMLAGPISGAGATNFGLVTYNGGTPFGAAGTNWNISGAYITQS